MCFWRVRWCVWCFLGKFVVGFVVLFPAVCVFVFLLVGLVVHCFFFFLISLIDSV